MKLIIYPFLYYTRNFMPSCITGFLEKVADGEYNNIKYWFISGVMSLVFAGIYYNLFRR